MDRRSFNKAAGAVAAASLAPGLAFGQNGPIRIGLLAPLTGVVASGGKEMVEAFNFFWDRTGKKAGGRAIEVIVEDDASNPDTAKTSTHSHGEPSAWRSSSVTCPRSSTVQW